MSLISGGNAVVLVFPVDFSGHHLLVMVVKLSCVQDLEDADYS